MKTRVLLIFSQAHEDRTALRNVQALDAIRAIMTTSGLPSVSGKKLDKFMAICEIMAALDGGYQAKVEVRA